MAVAPVAVVMVVYPVESRCPLVFFFERQLGRIVLTAGCLWCGLVFAGEMSGWFGCRGGSIQWVGVGWLALLFGVRSQVAYMSACGAGMKNVFKGKCWMCTDGKILPSMRDMERDRKVGKITSYTDEILLQV